MSPEEACSILGIPEGSTPDQVEAAFKRRAKQTHPDHDRQNPDAARNFQRIKEARDRLRRHLSAASGSTSQSGAEKDDREDAGAGADTSSGHDADEPADRVSLIRRYLIRHGLEVTADGRLEKTSNIKRAETREQFRQVLLQREPTFVTLLDQIALDPELREAGLRRPDAAAALREIVAADSRQRSAAILLPLMTTLGPHGRQLMLADLINLVAATFKDPPHLVVAVLLHFIWQVFQKALSREVTNPMMPVLWSAEQGTGKSTFVRHFCAPIRELLSPPIAAEDFIDPRFSAALDYPVPFLDEIPLFNPRAVDALKLILASEWVLRALPMTRRKARIRQLAVPIGTANRPPERSFYDPSGNRRFASIEQFDLRNQPEIWKSIEQFNFSRVWRMVDPLGPSPLVVHLDEVRAHQAKHAVKSPMLIWLLGLEVGSEEMEKFHQFDGYGSDPLRAHFNAQMGLDWNRDVFSKEMERHYDNPLTPFKGKRDIRGRTYYRLKAKS